MSIVGYELSHSAGDKKRSNVQAQSWQHGSLNAVATEAGNMIMAAAKAIARQIPPIGRLITQRDELLNEVLKAKPATDFFSKLSAINGVAAVKTTANRPVLLTSMGSPTADPAHALYPRFLEELRQRSVGHILEVGARARSGITRREAIPVGWRYTGLDVVNGPNVDVVGDAHQLSRLFPEQHFDAIMTFSTLEHLMMPWKFAIELNKVLTHGAIGLFFTHHTWPLHEVPGISGAFRTRRGRPSLIGPPDLRSSPQR
jgi:Methyltransferase domain